VFGNAAPHALAEMLPPEQRQSFMKRFARRPLSLSMWTIALGFDRKPRELGVEHYSTAVFPAPMRTLRDTALQRFIPGRPDSGETPHYIFVDYGSTDTGLADRPPYLGTIAGVDRVENWQGLSESEYSDRRERFIDRMVGALEQEFPGIGSGIVQRSMTTATGAARYLGTPQGAIYGFAPERRPQVVDPRTSIKGLWLASAFAGLGGYSGAMIGAGWGVKSALRESWRDWDGG
jgi:phytoene dehydrogenase-like protein